MSNFLTFLSNNYLYFLIAAGVLFFALMGFLVDLFKKKKEISSSNNINEETPIPNVTLTEENQVSNLDNAVNTNNLNVNNADLNETTSSFVPTPEVPAESIDLSSTEVFSENLNETPTLNSTEVLGSTETIGNNAVSSPEIMQDNQQVNQNQTVEEFK